MHTRMLCANTMIIDGKPVRAPIEHLKPLVEHIANAYAAMLNCQQNGNKDWYAKHKVKLEKLVYEYMPSGSGFDNGTTFDYTMSRADMLVFNTAFHAMDEHGMYDGWFAYTVRVRPAFVGGISISVQGRDHEGTLKDYIAETFNTALTTQRLA